MKIIQTETFGYTVRATIQAEQGETLIKENIEERFFQPFGGHIISMAADIAHIIWYND